MRLAESWTRQQTSANEVGPGSVWGTSHPDTIPDNNTAGLLYTFNYSAATRVETAVLSLNLVHSRASDLRITMASPSGTETTLLAGGVGGTKPVNQLRLTSNAFLGENSEGTWSVRVVDLAAGQVGTISGGSFSLFGSRDTPHDTFIYTDQFAALAAADIWRTFLNGNNGRDMLNAAAVTGPCFIDLRGTATGAGQPSAIAGTTLRILGGIEDAVTGDGRDTIIGSNAGNWLRGMRGNDSISGGGGNDTIEGGRDNDRLFGDAGADRIFGQAGNDTIVGGAGGDRLNGGFADVMESRGRDGNDSIFGGGGNDTIIASLERDTVDGGPGIDLLSFAWTRQGVVADLRTGVANFTESGGWTDPGGLGGGVWVRASTTFISRVEDLAGGAGNDRLLGNGRANGFNGNAGDDTLNGRGGDDRLLGNAGNDRLIGGGGNDTLAGGAGNDRLIGGAGNDRLIGGPGADTLQGGPGADTFFFEDVSHSTPGARDRILDFSRGQGDKIHLRNIDAIASTPADDAFTFIGAGPFSGKAGELRLAVSNNTVVSGDVTGNGKADFQIVVVGVTNLVAGDFLL